MKTIYQSFNDCIADLTHTTKPIVILYPCSSNTFPKVEQAKEFIPAMKSTFSKNIEINYLGFTKNVNPQFHQVFIKCLEENKKKELKFSFGYFIEAVEDVQSKLIVEFHIFLEHFEQFVQMEHLEQMLIDSEELQYTDLVIHFPSKKGELDE